MPGPATRPFPEFELTSTLATAAREFGADKGFAVHVELKATDDAFYAESPESIAKLCYAPRAVEMGSGSGFGELPGIARAARFALA